MANPPNPYASVDQILNLINRGAMEMNNTKVCIKQAVTIINEKKTNVNTMLREAAAAGGGCAGGGDEGGERANGERANSIT